MLAAKIAADFDLIALGDDALGLGRTQAVDHAAHALAAAGAGETRGSGANCRFKPRHGLFPEQAAQNGVHVQRQQLVAFEAGGQNGDTPVVFVAADLVLVTLHHQAAREIFHALHGQALDQQAGGHLVIRRQHQGGVKLLALQHVVGQHLAQPLQLFLVVAKQGHHALVGLLPLQFGLGVECDRAAAVVVGIDHGAQAGASRHLALHGGRGAQAQIALHFGHCQLDRAVAMDLQDQRAIKLDARLHQHARRRHFTQQRLHWQRVGAGGAVGGAARQDLGPGAGQAHDGAAHRQAVKNEFVEF